MFEFGYSEKIYLLFVYFFGYYFKLKYDEAKKWNLEQSLTNDAL